MAFTSDDFDSLLKGLLEAYSPSHEERPASDYLAAWMQSAGFDRAYVDDAGNAVGVIGDGPQEIVLLGHIDTVPGYINVEVRDGKLYGRGSVDAKGPLATFAAAAAQAGKQPGWRLVVVGAVEEEAASSKGARFAATQYKPAMCVIGEPSQWDRVTLGYKGRLLLDYRCSRTMSHTASLDRSAPEQAIDYWNAISADIKAINEGRERAFDQVMPSIRKIQSSDDGFCETAEMTLGFRLPLDVPPDVLQPKLLAHAENAEITFRGAEVAFRSERNTPLVRAFNNAIRDVGGKPGYVTKTGTADMNVVGPIWNCPIVAYGPGDSALDHTPEEHIVLDDYHQAIAVLTNVLRSLSETPNDSQ
jgi:[amino group carrier protein]-lysine/ornithine hydrolase